MSLVQILLNTVTYSLAIIVTLVGHLAARRTESPRLRAYAGVLLSVWSIIIVFFVAQVLDIVGKPAIPAPSYGIAVKALGQLFVVAAALFAFAFCEFIRVAAGLGKEHPARAIAFWIPLAVSALSILASAFGFLPGPALPLSRLSGLFPSFAVPAFAALALAFYVWAWKRIDFGSARAFRALFLALLALTVCVETAAAFLPLGTGQVFWDSDILELAFCLLSAFYIRAESEAPPAAETRHARKDDVDGALSAYRLSPREREVLDCILQGLSNNEIAERLFISLATVKSHTHRILAKTGRGSRTALLAWLAGFRDQNQSKD